MRTFPPEIDLHIYDAYYTQIPLLVKKTKEDKSL